MSDLSKPRKLELIDYIQHVLDRTQLLQSYANPNQKIARSAWGIIEQLIRVSERHKFESDEERKEQFFAWVKDLPSLSKQMKVNEADLKKLETFLMQPEFQAMTFQEIKYVAGWIHRLSEGNE